MTQIPREPKIYHITHVDNLRDIIARGGLLSDRLMTARGGPKSSIGMASIKQRRLHRSVDCHPSTMVGDYVPFYFCPRSIMLYVLHRGNQSALDYKEGQRLIVHLEADLGRVIRWADEKRRLWAFSLSNAAAFYTTFHSSPEQLKQLKWEAIAANDFRDPSVKEDKQAEFLLHGEFPFDLVERIGVQSRATQTKATQAVDRARPQPPVEVKPSWYF